MANLAEMPDTNLMRAGFEVNATASDIAAQQLRDAAAANRDIAVQVGRLPHAAVLLQGQGILAEIQAIRNDIRNMRTEFGARFVKGLIFFAI